MQLCCSDSDLCTEIGLPASIAVSTASSTRTATSQSEHREDGLYLIAKSDPHFKVSFYFDIEDLLLLVGGHLVRVPRAHLTSPWRF
jgi:hypothetical protein